MKPIYLIIALTIGLSLTFMSIQTINSDRVLRKEKWAKIENNIKSRKDPKTTLKWCKEILKEIEKGNFPDEEIKAKIFIYHLNYQISDDTDHINHDLLKNIDKDIKDLSFPQRNYMALLGYKLIQNYINRESWNIKKRHVNYLESDITTWQIEHFNKKAEAYRTITYSNAKQLRQIPIHDANFLFVSEDSNHKNIQNVYQAILYTDQELLFQNFLNTEFSSLDIEDAFTEESSNSELQKLILTSKKFRNEFDDIIQARLQMEFWTQLTSIETNPKIEDIYLNNLIALNTLNNPELEATRNFQIAKLYFSKANKISWNSIKNIDDINTLKTEKTTEFINSISYLDQIIHDSLNLNTDLGLHILTTAKQLKREITSDTSFSISGEKSYTTNQDLVFNIDVRNIKTINLEVYKINANEYAKKTKTLNWKEKNSILSVLNKKENLWNGTYKIDYASKYIEDERQIIIPKLDYGLYALSLKGDQNKSFIFQVTDLYVEKAGNKIIVKSAKDYSTVKQAVLCEGLNDNNKCYNFDKNGALEFNSKNDNFYSVVNKNDVYYLFNQYFNHYSPQKDNRTYFQDEIFTDRAIYRPGQKVHIKVLQKSKKQNDILYALSKKNKIEIELRDSQYEIIEKKTISLNDFSSAHTSFTLPKDVLNGQFQVITPNGRESIQVEEYKRPTFFIEYKNDSTEKRLGDIVQIPIEAKTFSGLSLANAKIEYTVKYSNIPTIFWRCGYYSWSESYILNHQVTKLDNNGQLIIEVNSNDIPEVMKENNLVQFTLEAKVIDINGDSETEETSFILSKNGLSFNTLKDIETLENKNFGTTINLSNFQDISIIKPINYEVWKLKEPKHILQKSNARSENTWLLPVAYQNPQGLKHTPVLHNELLDNWQQLEKVSSGQFTSSKPYTFNYSPKAGIYRIKYTTKDNKGNLITKNQYLKVRTAKGKPKLKDENIFVNINQTTFQINDVLHAQVYLPFSSNYEYVLSDLNGILETGTVTGERILNIKHKILDRSKGGIVLDVKTAYNNKLYEFTSNYTVDWALNLETKWVNIRHKIKPQSEENWQLQVTNETKPVEVLAFMYDASLDEIKKHSITQHIDQKRLYTTSNYLKGYLIEPYFNNSLRSDYKPYYSHELTYFYGVEFEPTLNIVRIKNSNRYYNGRRSYKISSKAVAGNAEPVMESMIATESFGVADSDFELEHESESVTNENKSKQAQIRKNFQETIFFYPELLSEGNGLINIPFKMSDGMGQYKLMVYGHTKDYKQFYLEEDIISNKELMAEMHKPRFLYSGDKIIWTAKIANLSDQIQNAEVQLNLSDGLNHSLLFSSPKTKMSISPGESKSITWTTAIPKDMVGELKYELKAESSNFIDVEIDQIPVLTTQTLIKENFALTIPARSSKTFTLSDLMNSSNPEQFRLECMPNPIWQVIKALPYAKSKNDKIISNLLDEYITIKIGEHILKNNPNISESLLKLSKQPQKSKLREKQELKSISLEESPWITDAKNQEEEMKQLAHFFDKNNLQQRIKTIERKITKHQNSSGGFPWIKGGKDSYGMSLYVANSLAKLEKLGLGIQDLKALKTNLLFYLDQEVYNQFKKLKINDSLKNIKVSHVNYLETRTYFLNNYPTDQKLRQAYDFYLERSLQHWTDANFVNRIALAKIAHGNGNLKIYDEIFKTINEYRIDHKEQQTIYWKELANGLSWNNRKLVNHASLIDLYMLQGNNTKDIYKLQNWLLQQKRSQHWGNSSETSQLIYALLFNVNDSNIFDKVPVDIKLNGKKVEFKQLEGWLSKTWKKDESFQLEKAKIEVINHTDHPIWLSGHQQYFDHISNIKTEKDNECTVNKTFYKRVIKNNNNTWVKTELNNLKPGDEVKVNVKITTPQQLDFVYLQDYFGACFEPTDRISGFKYNNKGSYYLNIKDQKMQFFFDRIARGTHEFEFKTRIKHAGTFSNGYAEFQSFYAPEYGGHSDSREVTIEAYK